MLCVLIAGSRCDEMRLMERLFRRHDRTVRPRLNSSQTVDVAIRFSLQQINDLVRLNQLLRPSL